MEILYLSQRFPYPPDRGDRIATFHHIRSLSRHHRVHVAALLDSRRDAAKRREMLQWAATVTVERQTRWNYFWGKVRALCSGQPLSLGHFFNRRLRARIRRLVAAERIDAVVVFSSSMAPYVERLPKLRRVMDFCDLDSKKWEDLALRSRGWRRRIYRREARLLLAYEKKIARAFDVSCVVTENEAALFRTLIPNVPVALLPNGVDCDYFGALPRSPAAAPRFTFIGVMDYEPNAEAAVFFCAEVWPRLRQRLPQAEFYLVGSRPNRPVLALARNSGVTVTGFVPDVRPYLAASTLVVVPLQVARGVQNKILEAMAAGVPVLASPAAAAGLPEEARAAMFVADREPEAFLQGLLGALADPEARRLKAEAAQRFVRAHVSWDETGRILETLLLPTRP